MARPSVTMLDVVNELHLKLYNTKGNNSDYYCPFCEANGKKHHHSLNVNFSNGTFNCFKCGSKGGYFKLYSMYQALINHNENYYGDGTSDECQKQASKDMVRILSGYSYEKQEIRKNRNKQQQQQLKNIAKMASSFNLKKSQIVYEALLKHCTLTKVHRQNLKNRGMSDFYIDKYRIKSVPTVFPSAVIQRITTETGIQDFSGVAGFYYDEESLSWQMVIGKHHKGMFIPYYDVNNKICGLQIRLDTPTVHGDRYIWFSSVNRNRGTSVPAVPCYLKGTKRNNNLYITEGALKAMVSQSLTGWSFLAVAGVNSQQGIEEAMTKFNGSVVYDCFDMDYVNNPNVSKAKENLANKIISAGKELKRQDWDSNYKGIDDYLLHLITMNNKKSQ
ncbi:MAG: DUF3854 domain-containing protein [Acutalibacteraceae bacterium]|nr:DUF3854 domain-containing protein [Acutalibacteraceae bacterium]